MASVRASWSPEARDSARRVLARIAAEEAARTSREVRAQFPAGGPPDLAEVADRFGATMFPQPSPGAHTLHCATAHVGALADWLLSRGAASVVVAPLDYVFAGSNGLWERLAARLPRAD